MIVSGEKVYLRLPNEKDIDILYIWENDPEIWEAGDNKSPLSKKEIANFNNYTLGQEWITFAEIISVPEPYIIYRLTFVKKRKGINPSLTLPFYLILL